MAIPAMLALRELPKLQLFLSQAHVSIVIPATVLELQPSGNMVPPHDLAIVVPVITISNIALIFFTFLVGAERAP
jgi:hypothetical protein